MATATEFLESAHVITSTFTDGPIFNISGAYALTIAVTNNGASALNAFELWGRPVGSRSDYAFFKLKSSAFTTPDFFLLQAVTDPTTLASGSSSVLILNVDAMGAVKIVAKSAGTSNLVISGASFA